MKKVETMSQVAVDYNGMRPESLDIVRAQRASNAKMRPIEVDVYPDVGPMLADGRHRLAIARELGDETIDAVVRVYNEDGNVLSKRAVTLRVA